MLATRRTNQKRSKKQALWGYMRRNPLFCVGDAMLVADVSIGFCRSYFWHLRGAGYLEQVNSEKRLINKQYKLIKNTGVKSPSTINGVLYDYNTCEEYHVRGEKR